MGWAPWRLIQEFPEEMIHHNMGGKNKVPAECYETKYSPPFNELELSISFLYKVAELYKDEWKDEWGDYRNESFGFMQLFLCDLRDAFYLRFEFQDALNRYSKLLDLVDYYRTNRPDFPVDELLIYSGLMLWEQTLFHEIQRMTRTDIRKAKKLIAGDADRLDKHLLKVVNELGFGSLQSKYHFRLKKIRDEIIEDVQAKLDDFPRIKRESSPVFIYLNIKLVNLLNDHFSSKEKCFQALASFYELYGVPGSKDVDFRLVRNYYTQWVHRQDELLAYTKRMYSR